MLPLASFLVYSSGTTSTLSSTQYLISELQLVPLGPKSLHGTFIRRNIFPLCPWSACSLNWIMTLRLISSLCWLWKELTSPRWFPLDSVTFSLRLIRWTMFNFRCPEVSLNSNTNHSLNLLPLLKSFGTTITRSSWQGAHSLMLWTLSTLYLWLNESTDYPPGQLPLWFVGLQKGAESCMVSFYAKFRSL